MPCHAASCSKQHEDQTKFAPCPCKLLSGFPQFVKKFAPQEKDGWNTCHGWLYCRRVAVSPAEVPPLFSHLPPILFLVLGHYDPRPMARVLIVEDDQKLRLIIGRRLGNLGYAILFAVDGEEALFVLDNHQADLVVLDFMLPKMDGAAVVDALGHDPRWKDLPVIMMSGRDPAEVKATIGENEIAAVLCKGDKNFMGRLVDEVKKVLTP